MRGMGLLAAWTFLALALLFPLLLLSCGPKPRGVDDTNVRVKLDASQAEAVLAVARARGAGAAPDSAMWQRLFSCEPYLRFKKREHEMGDRFNVPELKFSDDDFRRFVLSDDLVRRAPGLARTLEEWRKADLEAAGARVLAYLPAGARIRAKFYPMIKPFPNSFVYEMSADPAVFLYLDTAWTVANFENTVAHEMHHIGLASLDSMCQKALEGLAPRPRAAAAWLGAFGEGFAMLAAAGGPDVHPHAASPEAERRRWDRDMARFNRDLREVEDFLMGVAEGSFKDEEAANDRGMSFFGIQGPWYTVGHRMSVMVEKRWGRKRLLDCMLDTRLLLRDYNLAAAEHNKESGDTLATWSPELLKALGLVEAVR